MSDGTQLFIVLFHFFVQFVHHRDGARHYKDHLLQYLLLPCTLHPVKRASVSRILLFKRKFCAKTSFIFSWLKLLLWIFTYTQNAVVEL